MIKKLLIVFLFFPVIGFSQTNLTSLLFQLIDSKDARMVLESEGWRTNSINTQIDEYDVRYNELKFSKLIYNNDETFEASSYFTIKEYPTSNIVTLKVYNKSFYNQFQEIIVKSGYKKVFNNVSNNTLEYTYEKNPIEVNFKEELNNYYLITLLKYKKNHQQTQHFRKNAFITADRVNVRNNPSVNSEIMGQLNNKDKVFLVDVAYIFVNKQFILDKKTVFYTNKREYILNSGKMISQINTPVLYNGGYITTDSIWITASVNIDKTDISGLIRKNDISAANTQKWYKIKFPEFSGWVYGDFVRENMPPPPPPPSAVNEIIENEEETTDEVFMIAEDMPMFKGCSDDQCTQGEILKFIARNTMYPPIAKENNITGRVFVSFIVDKTGKVTNVKILRGIDKHLDAEAIRVVSSLPEFFPGKQRGKFVKVQYNVPISFKLN